MRVALRRWASGLALALATAAVQAALPPLAPMDVFDLQYASSPQVGSQGRRVLYLRHSMDVMRDQPRSNLWSVDVDGSNHRPITSGGRAISQFALSPDSSRVAYVDRDDTGAQVFMHWLDTQHSAQLTRLPEAPRQLRFSPDGRWLAFTMLVPVKAPSMGELPPRPAGAEWAAPPVVVQRSVYRNDGAGPRREGFYHVFVMPAEGGSARQLSSGDFDHTGGLLWARDSASLFVSANRGEDWETNPVNTDIFRINLADGALTRLTDRQGPDRVHSLSADGSLLAFTGWDDEGKGYHRQRLYVMRTDGSERRELLPDFDRDIFDPTFSSEGERIFFHFDERGDTLLASTDLNGRLTRHAAGLGGTSLGRPYAGAGFGLGPRDLFALTVGDTRRPADIAIGQRGSDKLRRLTALNENLLAHRELATVEERWLKSSADGTDIQAWVALPPGFDPTQRYPLLLEIHGGPFTNYGARFAAEIQLYAAAGYVVLYVNPRGSTSYGEAFANLIHHAYPGQDYDDLISAVDAVIAEGYIDPQQLYVTGGSGGGVLTAWIVGKTDRFRAAVVAKPVINWASFVLTADNPPYFSRYWFPKMPWEDPEGYWARSPLSLVGNVSTPTMLLTGENDLRTPISESEQYYQALKLRGVDTALVRVPGASHSIARRPSQLLAKVAAVLAWFDRHAGEVDEAASEALGMQPGTD